MRRFAFLGMFAMVALATVPASAQTDLDSLLGELTYGESQLVSENEDVADSADEDLLTLPSPSAPETSPSLADDSQDDDGSLSPTLPVNPGPPLPDAMLSERLKARPSTPEPAVAGGSSLNSPSGSPPSAPTQVDFGQMFQPGSPTATDAALSVPHQAGCGCQTCHEMKGVRHGSHHQRRGLLGHHRGDESCDSPYECRPHHRPTLPPPSSMIQYFRSRNANSDIWAGYEKEAQEREDHHYRHVRGDCDCHDKSQRESCLSHKPPVYWAQAPGQCQSWISTVT